MVVYHVSNNHGDTESTKFHGAKPLRRYAVAPLCPCAFTPFCIFFIINSPIIRLTFYIYTLPP